MTTEHPITPPPELVQQWYTEADNQLGPYYDYIATQAARWGAEQELEACCEWVGSISGKYGPRLRLARRPKPLSLAEEALEVLKRSCFVNPVHEDIIRHALVRLQELEKGNE